MSICENLFVMGRMKEREAHIEAEEKFTTMSISILPALKKKVFKVSRREHSNKSAYVVGLIVADLKKRGEL